MAAAHFSGILKRATGVLQNLGLGDQLKFPGKDGDILYSKNNVCVHPPSAKGSEGGGMNRKPGEPSVHSPGYLTIYCQQDETCGVTLVLQWLPNSTLEKNPKSIHTISPKINSPSDPSKSRVKLRHLQEQKRRWKDSSSDSSSSPVPESEELTTPTSDIDEPILHSTPQIEPVISIEAEEMEDAEISVKMNGDQLTVTSVPKDRPQTLITTPPTDSTGLGVPSINVIPHTPITPDSELKMERSPETSGADDNTEGEDDPASSPYSSEEEGSRETPTGSEGEGPSLAASLLIRYRNTDLLEASPEDFAQKRNLTLPDGIRPEESPSSQSSLPRHSKSTTPSLFSVDLGKMRSMRLFYSNPECTSGQLVIASPESQYKILHFHHGGLDKLAQIFEQWSLVRARSLKGGSPDPFSSSKHFAICHPEVSKGELHPEEGLYDQVNWDFWRHSTTPDGAVEDSHTLRKAIFFGGVEKSLRKEAWSFLLGVYPWNSTIEQREAIRNDLFLEYQNLRKKRMKDVLKVGGKSFLSIDNTITKDVVRTDRKNPYYQGDDNPNMETMRNILLNYAFFCPQIGYIQGMSDLLAPILATIQDESDAFWSFAGLMQRTIFVSIPRNNNMDKNLEYLRELLKLQNLDFYKYLQEMGSDALALLFTHRWILLCFKREFPEVEALRIWEACWSDYHTGYFHLFISAAIIGSYGEDARAQALPIDEMLLYFSSLAMHMDGEMILKKARGLLHQFCRLVKVPCTLWGLCDFTQENQWDTSYQPLIECVQVHENNLCPHIANAGQE